MAGAVDLAACGIRSSLFSDNVQMAPHLLDLNDARTALLFDPQTCGGLLAAVPEAYADEALARLVAAGSSPAIIGRVLQGPARLSYA
jgi:selenide,water dikinase